MSTLIAVANVYLEWLGKRTLKLYKFTLASCAHVDLRLYMASHIRVLDGGRAGHVPV